MSELTADDFLPDLDYQKCELPSADTDFWALFDQFFPRLFWCGHECPTGADSDDVCPFCKAAEDLFCFELMDD